MSENAGSSVESARIETDLIEWAIQRHTRDGDLHTGQNFTTEREAIASGERLERINGAEWWLVSRRRFVTVRTSAWEKTDITYPLTSPATVAGGDDD